MLELIKSINNGRFNKIRPIDISLVIRSIKYNGTKFDEWTREGKAPPVPAALFLYNTLLSMGIKPVFISGTKEEFRQIRITNLNKVGYHSWIRLILK